MPLVRYAQWAGLGLAAALLLVMREASALLGQLQSAGARSYDMGTFTNGRVTFWDTSSMRAAVSLWHGDDPANRALAARWMSFHVSADTIFTCLYCAALLFLLKRAYPNGWKMPAILAGAVFVADQSENILTWAVSGAVQGSGRAPTPVLVLLALLTCAKWVAVSVAVAVAGLRPLLTPIGSLPAAAGPLAPGQLPAPVMQTLLANADAVLTQIQGPLLGRARVASRLRVQLVAVAVLAAFVALPGGGPLEQLTDVLRGLFEGSAADMVRDAGPTVLALVVFSGALYVSGRWALLPYARLNSERDDPWPPVARLAIGLVLVVVAAISNAMHVPWATGGMYAVPLVLGVLALLSAWVTPGVLSQRLLNRAWPPTSPPPTDPVRQVDYPAAAGRRALVHAIRVTAALPVTIAALGLVRAFAAPSMLKDGSGTGLAPEVLLAVGIVGAVVAGPLTCATLAWLDGGAALESGAIAPGGAPRPALARTAAGAFTAVVASMIVLLAVFPLEVGGWWQLDGILMVWLSGVVLTWGWIRQQTELRLPAFWVWRLRVGRRSPVFAAGAVVLVLAGVLDTSGGYHDVRLLKGASSAPEPTTLADAWQTWTSRMESAASCRGADLSLAPPVAPGAAAQVAERPTVPLLLLAAPGGGIRAAYWTAAALDALMAAPVAPASEGASVVAAGAGWSACVRQATFALSGVSGGSLGISAWLTTAAGQSSREVVARVAGPQPLAADGAAMLTRDLPRAFSGVNALWDDRAGVLERAWEAAAPALRGSFDDATRQPQPAASAPSTPGASTWTPLVLLNSTSVSTGCRVLITQLDIVAAQSSADECRSPLSVADRTRLAVGANDSRDYLTDRSQLHRGRCPDSPPAGHLAVSTAAHLSARFGYVSPSGTMVGCVPGAATAGGKVGGTTEVSGIAAIDGGYLENSGLQALLQLWDGLEPSVATWNEDPASAFTVVPLLALTDNHYQSSAKALAPKRATEGVVPVQGKGAAAAAMSSQAWEQLAVEKFLGPPPGVATCGTPVVGRPQKTGWLCRRSFRIAPDVRPQVAAPLGWSLSKASRDNLDSQLTSQFSTCGEKCPSFDATGALRACDLRVLLETQALTLGVKLVAEDVAPRVGDAFRHRCSA